MLLSRNENGPLRLVILSMICTVSLANLLRKRLRKIFNDFSFAMRVLITDVKLRHVLAPSHNVTRANPMWISTSQMKGQVRGAMHTHIASARVEIVAQISIVKLMFVAITNQNELK